MTSLRKKHPGNARVAYLLGNLYLEKLWGQEGFDAYKAAVRNDPAYRKDPVLIRASVRMLVSDTHGWRASRFLRDEIGKDAIPYLEEVQNSKVTRIRQSARRLLAELR